jgi:2Fe-2S ferredoxin
MPKITFANIDRTCEASEGQSILDVAIENDVPLQHACGGFCACTTCHVHVKSGQENLSEMEELEEDRIDMATQVTPRSRLGCQARIRGDVVVDIVNIDE